MQTQVPVQTSSTTYRIYNGDGSSIDVKRQDPTALTFVGQLTGGPAATLAGSATTIGGFGGTATLSSSASARKTPVVNACTIKNLYVLANGTQPSDGALVITLLKNGLPSSITITIAANASITNAVVTDLTHTATFAAGDLIGLQFANASASASVTITSYSVGMYNLVN